MTASSASRSRRPGRFEAALAAAVLGLLTAAGAPAQDDWRFAGVERVVAVADIHGAYAAFERILERTGLIGEDRRWTGERTHLVIVGDVVDRGADSRRALDLIRALEAEAAAAGGAAHLVLGNHEIMNMTGDLRYVAAGEYAAFAAEESQAQREAAFAGFAAARGGGAGEPALRRAFDEAFPPGYFAHRAAFSSQGEYGRWLLGKPVLLVIDGTAFVHGGLAGGMARDGENLNARVRAELQAHLAAYERLLNAGLLPPTLELFELPAAASEILARGGGREPTAAERAAARQLLEIDALSFLDPDGPVWYRGNVACNRLSESDRLEAALDAIGAERLVVGHTPTPGAVVLSRSALSLLRIDTGMLNAYYGGRAAALVLDGGALSVVYADEADPARPIEQPRRVGQRPGGLTAEALEQWLARAEVVARRPLGDGATLVALAADGVELEARFSRAESRAINPAVAAYRLDRLLGLDMVPVTVARELDGIHGALQLWPAGAIDETERSAQQLGGAAWCPLGDQLRDMYLFDALIFNRARTADTIRYSTDNFELLLVGNEQSFSTDRGRPDYLAAVPVELNPAWREALGGLDEATLAAALGELIDRRRIRAVLARRDRLLELAE